MPQMLACRYTDKDAQTQIQPMRNNNGVFSAFGNPYTPVAINGDSITNSKGNLIIQFGPEFYCAAGREMRIYNPSTQNWDVDIALLSVSANNGIGGIYLGRGPTGAPRLIVAFNETNDLSYRTLDVPGGTWSPTVDTSLTVPSQSPGMHLGVVINNILFTDAFGVNCTINFSTGGAAVQSVSSPDAPYLAYTLAAGRIFAFANAATGSAYSNVYEYIGGAFIEVIAAADPMPRAGGSGVPVATASWQTAHYDEASDSLILHAWQQSASSDVGNPGGSGWYVIQIPLSTLIPANITSAVAPPALDVPAGPSPLGDVRWVIEVDSDTDPTTPITYIWNCHAGGGWARFQWNGVGSPMTALGTGGGRGIALSHNPMGGGQYFFDPSTTLAPGYHIEEVMAREPIVGGTRVFLQGYQLDETGGVPTPSDETVGLYWGIAQATPDNLASLSNAVKVSGPGSAPGISANKITGFTFDGTSIYSVEWAAVSDGVPDQAGHMLMPHVEI